MEYLNGGFEDTAKRTKELSVVLLHDSAIEDCIVSEISSTSKVRTSSGDKLECDHLMLQKNRNDSRNKIISRKWQKHEEGGQKSKVWALCDRTGAM
jgi:hypothetical protein